MQAMRPTGVENLLGEEELIVSKTDLKGRITYANDVFIRMAKYSWKELMGAPHSLIRHPDMPRAVFKLLWDTLQSKQEIFAYVVNLAKDGSHYWVFAHVTPTFDERGNIVGYHSNRRKPDPAQIERIKPIYKTLCTEEARHANAKEGMQASFEAMVGLLKQQGVGYDEFVLSL
ncbi:PAS domain S-box-containing protein [Bradyrhizobium yuanmingense]|uniref:PAS domain S-box-containing protein n=1 Tax=Bradyrhizobium yuanmingense TaxID=108015 RepID=A0A1C3TZ28_9BRAD|nr:PAS domain-containing protein [Bradyrhizobium yuanmingense]TWI30612.1 PAS domain S-box-containing protein [Bradyrhizobium yuanmingense]SCB08464.1 PAS domain S-box-containing protein [Bradyrhizobium yuanmingense]